MKIEPYISMDSKPNKDPCFSIRFSDENTSFDIHDLTEAEVRELIKDLQDQLYLYLNVDAELQESIKGKKLRASA